jgi:hypothetical protein
VLGRRIIAAVATWLAASTAWAQGDPVSVDDPPPDDTGPAFATKPEPIPRVDPAASDGCGPIATDRPGATIGHGSEAPGCFQIEASLAVAHLQDTNFWLLQAPTVLRVGVLPRFELRFETGVFELARENDPRSDVGGNTLENPVVTFAAKLLLLSQQGRVPGLGFYAAVDLDEASFFSGDSRGWRATPRALLLFDWAFVAPMNLSINVGIAGPPEGDGGGRDVVIPFAVVLSAGLPEGVSPFVDLASSVSGGRVVQSLGGGLAWQFDPKLQLDAGFSVIVVDGSSRGDDVGGWTLSAGFSLGN